MEDELTLRIHYSGEDYEDSIILKGTIEEIRERAHAEALKRGWDESQCWSEEVRR